TETGSGCVSQITQKLYIGVKEPLCKTRIQATRINDDSVVFVARTNGRYSTSYTYSWDFGDNTFVNNTKLLQHFKQYANNTINKVMLVTDDHSGCVDTSYYNFNSAPSSIECEANFDYK